MPLYAVEDTVTTEQERLELFLTTRTEESFSLLCASLYSRLIRYFRARSCDQVTAEDLTQDVLFTLYRKAYTIRRPQLFQAWLYKVAHNALLQRLRSARRRIQTVSQSEVRTDAWESIPAQPAGGHDFEEAMAALNVEEREILLLRFADGLDYQEIAATLGIPVGTAKWRVFNSKLKLAAELRRGGRK